MRASREAAALWIRLAKCYGLVLNAVRRSERTRPVTLSQFDVLAQLHRKPEGMTAGELSRALLVTAGNTTGLVARLQRQGLVTWREAREDRRVKRIRLTAAGRRTAGREVLHHERLLGRIFQRVPRRGRRDLQRGLERLRTALEPARNGGSC
jgi:DNA-binding MarR family transcriptional regulator